MSSAHPLLRGIPRNPQLRVDDPETPTEFWETADVIQGPTTNWLLSYIDILTLFLTLFAVLLALQPQHKPIAATPAADALAPALVETLSDLPPQPEEASADEPFQPIDVVAAPAFTAKVIVDDSAAPLTRSIELDLPLFDLPSPPEVVVEFPIPPIAETPPESTEAEDTTNSSTAAEPVVIPPGSNGEDPVHRLDLLVDKLNQQLDERVTVSQRAEGVHFEVRDTILFAPGSTELKAEGISLLSELARLFLEHPGIISVEGHTDDRPISTPRYPSNWELSSGRATVVTRHLVTNGLDPERLRAVGYADTRPLESNATEKGRARNRRVVLIVEIPEADEEQAAKHPLPDTRNS